MKYEEKQFPLKDGSILTIRSADKNDAACMAEYVKITAGETPYLLRNPDEINLTLKEEEAFVQSNISDPGSLLLISFVDGHHAGNASFSPVGNFRRYQHRCDIGIALYQKDTGRGIGRILLTEILQKAVEAGYEQAELCVAATNTKAIHLYESMGFQEYGRLDHSMKYDDGSYAADIFMVKRLKGLD